jgi:hypothetical protein
MPTDSARAGAASIERPSAVSATYAVKVALDCKGHSRRSRGANQFRFPTTVLYFTIPIQALIR